MELFAALFYLKLNCRKWWIITANIREFCYNKYKKQFNMKKDFLRSKKAACVEYNEQSVFY